MQQKQPMMKIENKLTKFIEDNSAYKGRREEIRVLSDEIKKMYGPELGVVKVTETVSKASLNEVGDAVKTQEVKQKKSYVDPTAEEMYDELKSKRRSVLRFNKKATLYINHICERIIEDFIRCCEPASSQKKSHEKTFGWKQFNNKMFEDSFVSALVQGSRSYCTFVDLKHSMKNLDYEKEISRLEEILKAPKSESRPSKKSVLQDLQKYKSMLKDEIREQSTKDSALVQFYADWEKLRSTHNQQKENLTAPKRTLEAERRTLEEQRKTLEKQVPVNQTELQQVTEQLDSCRSQLDQIKRDLDAIKEEAEEMKEEERTLLANVQADAQKLVLSQAQKEFGDVWPSLLTSIYDGMYFLQKSDDKSKMLFNMVKNTTKKIEKEINRQVAVTEDAPEKKPKLKIANGYKHLISRILREFLINFTRKIEVYLQGTHIKTVKLEDVSKILRIWVTHEETDTVNQEIQDFELRVRQEAEHLERSKSTTTSTDGTTQ